MTRRSRGPTDNTPTRPLHRVLDEIFGVASATPTIPAPANEPPVLEICVDKEQLLNLLPGHPITVVMVIGEERVTLDTGVSRVLVDALRRKARP